MTLKKIYFTLFVSTLLPSTLFATSSTYIPKTCPNNNPYHIVVNKQQDVSKTFIPQNLVVPNVKFSFSGYHEKKNLEQQAAKALEELFTGAKQNGIHLAAVSGYRSYERQSQLYNNYVKRDGQAKADTYSARPGTSEHQTGLSMDVSSASAGYNLSSSFGDTKEGQWLKDNAHHYGFIIRYPKDKEHITGYIYEPWHIRYVGPELANTLYTTGITLEEIESCCVKVDNVPPLKPTAVFNPLLHFKQIELIILKPQKTL